MLQVVKQMKVIWRKHRGVYVPGPTPFLHDIPLALHQDIAMEDFCWILQQVRDRTTSGVQARRSQDVI